MVLSDDQILRYSRQIILSEIGGTGQSRLLESRVLVIGAGGLGSPALLYLAAAGIGTIGIIDADSVDLTNLQRQIAHFTSDVNKPKVLSAKEKIEAMNPDVRVVTYHIRADSSNIAGIIKDYDFIIDGTDNFPSKFLINDACVLGGKAFSHAGIIKFSGQTLTHTPGHACYRCVFPAPPPKGLVPSCSEAGVIGTLAGIIGAVQATEAIKFLTGQGRLLTNRILIFETLGMGSRTVDIKRSRGCPVCGENPTIRELKDYEQPVCCLNKEGGCGKN